MCRFHSSAVMMCVGFTATFISLLLRTSQAVPTAVISNDVYPDIHLSPGVFDPFPVGELPPKDPPFSLKVQRNMSSVTDIREFIMKYVKDERICHSDTLRDLILGDGKSDRSANVWWAKRCSKRRPSTGGNSGNLPESTLIRYRRKSSKRARSQQKLALPPKQKKKLDKLLRNKKIQCNPKKAVVELPNENAPFTMLKPSCVYIKQCGGCCDSEFLECRPTKTKKRKFKVLALERKMSGADDLQFDRRNTLKTVEVEEHKACQCECKERKEHCTENQTYYEDTCQCQCHPDLRKSCPLGKVWSDKLCDCVCSDVSECTTGRYFDTETCRCADPPR